MPFQIFKSLRDAALGGDARWGDADEEFAGHAIARAVLVGARGTHVAGGDPRGPGAEFGQIVGEGGAALDDDVGEGRRLVIDAEGDATVAADVGGLDRAMPGGEDERVAVEREPDRGEVRSAILSDGGELGRAGAG